MTPDRKDALSSILQSVGRRYLRYVNKDYQRSGTLWEGRFKAGSDPERALPVAL